MHNIACQLFHTAQSIIADCILFISFVFKTCTLPGWIKHTLWGSKQRGVTTEKFIKTIAQTWNWKLLKFHVIWKYLKCSWENIHEKTSMWFLHIPQYPKCFQNSFLSEHLWTENLLRVLNVYIKAPSFFEPCEVYFLNLLSE